MAIIQPSTQPARWLIPSIVLDGQTLLSELTITNPVFDAEIIHAEGETEFLAAGQGIAYTPLPESGWLEAGEIYAWGGGLVIVRQSHNRTIYDPNETPALFMVYRPDAGDCPEWIAGEQVHVGDLRIYDGETYRCLQAHVTQTDWTPPAVPAIWELVQDEPDEYLPWVQPTGAHDAYNIGDRVTFNGHLWESRINANVWSPAVYPAGWLDLGIYP